MKVHSAVLKLLDKGPTDTVKVTGIFLQFLIVNTQTTLVPLTEVV
jgi:hypothetical protein